mmetsp:Transcript_53122/g.95921  ORF Transcript_53122/g.95921 Transcript_53122/m.95921 type:complete len:152 (-) Transcript_53122:17-472(-)
MWRLGRALGRWPGATMNDCLTARELRRGSGLPPVRGLSGDSKDDADNVAASEEESGLFSDAWWPDVAQRCHERLAARPHLLPEDPMAQGVLSWVEYELARSVPEPGKARPKKDEVPISQRDEPPQPLPEDGKWRWLLRSPGEIVGPKGERG